MRFCATFERFGRGFEELINLSEFDGKHPSGAEARVDSVGLMLGMNPRPTLGDELSRSEVVVRYKACAGTRIWPVSSIVRFWRIIIGKVGRVLLKHLRFVLLGLEVGRELGA